MPQGQPLEPEQLIRISLDAYRPFLETWWQICLKVAGVESRDRPGGVRLLELIFSIALKAPALRLYFCQRLFVECDLPDEDMCKKVK